MELGQVTGDLCLWFSISEPLQQPQQSDRRVRAAPRGGPLGGRRAQAEKPVSGWECVVGCGQREGEGGVRGAVSGARLLLIAAEERGRAAPRRATWRLPWQTGGGSDVQYNVR